MKEEMVVATKNKKKLEEIKKILKGLGLKITCLADYDNPPRIVEDGHTFRENAIKKALRIAKATKKFTLGEDSGLCVNVLGGEPGIYSSRFSGKEKSDLRNNLKLLNLLEGLPLHKRRAHYVCAVALADKDGLIGAVEAKCSGLIGFKMQGTYGFGYDPLFIIPRYKKTFAQLGPNIKHRMSHRFRALKKAKKIIFKYLRRKNA
jgi:XTP/dITP diphosphohydrolase